MIVTTRPNSAGPFDSHPQAERYIRQHGTITKLPRGWWRAMVNVNDRKIRLYGATEAIAVCSAAVALRQIFGERGGAP